MSSRAVQAPGPARDFSIAAVLRDGSRVTIRALRPDDRQRLMEAFRLLDADSVYTRFFMHRSGFSETEIERSINVDFVSEVALAVTIEAAGVERLIAVGRYFVLGGGAAEVAFVVEEDYQGRGIASRLLACLAVLGRAQGITRFEADVMARNNSMLAVFDRSGFPVHRRVEGNVAHLTLTLDAPDGEPGEAP